MDWRAGTDIGGTFTDIAYIDPDGFLFTEKVPSTPGNYGRGVVDGLADWPKSSRSTLAV